MAAPPVGTSADVEVKATAVFADRPGEKPSNVTVTFGVQPRLIPEFMYLLAPKVTAGGTATVPAPEVRRGEDITGLRFRKAAGAPSWVTVADDGSITVSPGRDVSGSFTIGVELYEPETGRSKVSEFPVTVAPAPKPTTTAKPSTQRSTTAKPSTTVKPTTTAKPTTPAKPSTQRSTSARPTQPSLATQQAPVVSGSSVDARTVGIVLAVLAVIGAAGFAVVSQFGQPVQ